MKLIEHLKLRTPLLWVTTDEPGRVTDKVIAESDRPVYRFDVLSGLLKWTPEREQWVQVLGPHPETGELSVIMIQGQAIQKVLDERAVMVYENAHASAEQMAGFFYSLVFAFRNAFYADDLDKVPGQFVLLSHKDEVPGEIARMTTHLRHELPDNDELISIIEHLSSQVKLADTPEMLARAGIGLSETEFITESILGANESGQLEAPHINAAKLELLKRNGILEVRTPTLDPDDLGGLDLAKELISHIDFVWNNPDEAEELGISPIRRILFVGVPGTGKSLICEAISSRLRLDLAKGGVSNSLSKWVGESEQNMRRMFATLKRMAPVVFWIDEFGRDMSGGGSANDGGTTDRVHGEFLTGIQELPENIFLAAAANRIEDLAPEILRADRFDRIMFVGFPTTRERQEIFKIHLGDKAADYDLFALASATDYFTGAEIKALIREVRFTTGVKERRAPTTAELLEFIPNVKGRVWINARPQIVAMYTRALVEWDWASSEQRDHANKVLADARQPVTPNATAPQVPKYTPKTTYSMPKFGSQ